MRCDRDINKKAFTIIELLIGICISGIILIPAFHILSSALLAIKIAARSSAGFQHAQWAMTTITSDIRAADCINPASTEKRLVISSGPDIILYEFTSGKIKRSVNSYGQYITPDGAIKELAFSYPFEGSVLTKIYQSNPTNCFTGESTCKN